MAKEILSMIAAQDCIVKHAGAVVTITSATTTNTTAVDLSGFEQAIGILKFGAIAASATCTAIKVQVSDDGSTYTDLVDAITPPTGQTGVTFADTSDNLVVQFALDLRSKAKKYLRYSLVTGTANSIALEFAGFVGVAGKIVPSSQTNANRLGNVITNVT
jgi:hypothetical protein